MKKILMLMLLFAAFLAAQNGPIIVQGLPSPHDALAYRQYLLTTATTANVCAISTSGLNTALCYSDGNAWHSIPVGDTTGNPPSVIPGNQTVTGNQTVGGTQSVTGAATFGGNVTIGTTVLSPTTGLSSTSNSLSISLGGNAASTDDSSILIHRAVINPLSTGGSHAVRDEGTYNPGSAAGGYSSFDSIYTYSGGVANNHAHSFQSRIHYDSVSNLGELVGYTMQANHTGAGTISTVFGLRMMDAIGSGPITMQAGLWCDSLTRGAANYCVYEIGANPNYFGGSIQTGSTVTAAGVVLGPNLLEWDAGNSVGIGTGTGAGGSSTVLASQNLGYYNFLGGYNAGHSQNTVGITQKNVFVGASAGYTNEGSGSVFIGYNAGYNEPRSGLLYIANSNTATPLVYGNFTTPALTLNGAVTIPSSYILTLGATSFSFAGKTCVLSGSAISCT